MANSTLGDITRGLLEKVSWLTKKGHVILSCLGDSWNCDSHLRTMRGGDLRTKPICCNVRGKNEGSPLGFCFGWGTAGLINPEDTKHPIHYSVYVQKSHLPLFYYVSNSNRHLDTLFCSNFLNKMICWKLAQPINLPTYNVIS